jgi:DNA repair protein RadC
LQPAGRKSGEAPNKARRVEKPVKLPVYSLKLVRERWATWPPISASLPQVAALFFHRLIGQAASEHAAALFLDGSGTPSGSTIIAMGSTTRVPMVAREVFKAAILANASSLIISHSHPSGSSHPSQGDLRMTQTLIKAGKIIGISVIDSIIVTPSGDFTSMREQGLMGEDVIRAWVTNGSGASLVADSPACPSSEPSVISGLHKQQKA